MGDARATIIGDDLRLQLRATLHAPGQTRAAKKTGEIQPSFALDSDARAVRGFAGCNSALAGCTGAPT